MQPARKRAFQYLSCVNDTTRKADGVPVSDHSNKLHQTIRVLQAVSSTSSSFKWDTPNPNCQGLLRIRVRLESRILSSKFETFMVNAHASCSRPLMAKARVQQA